MVCRCSVPPYRDGRRFRLPPSWGSFAGNGAADGLCLVVESGSMACRIGKAASRRSIAGASATGSGRSLYRPGSRPPVSGGLPVVCRSARVSPDISSSGRCLQSVGPRCVLPTEYDGCSGGRDPAPGGGLYRPGPRPPVSGGTSGRLPERARVSGHFVVGPLLAVSRAAVRTADGIR